MRDRDHNDESISFDFDSKNDADVRHKLRKFFKACEMSVIDEFTDELLSFTGTPQDRHDDYIDALAHAFNAIRKTPSIYI